MHVEPVGQLFPLSTHGRVGTGPIVTQTPLDPAGVQVAPVGHCEGAPTVQGVWRVEVDFAMQTPPQEPDAVGVQVEAGGQVSSSVTQVCRGGMEVAVGTQRPPQVMVGVQAELLGHPPLAPTIQGIVYIGGTVVDVV